MSGEMSPSAVSSTGRSRRPAPVRWRAGSRRVAMRLQLRRSGHNSHSRMCEVTIKPWFGQIHAGPRPLAVSAEGPPDGVP